MKRIPMTLNGEKKLRKELEFLKNVKRPEIIASLIEARKHGDLKENAEYQAAREEQSFLEGRIKEVERKLSNAYIVDVTQIQNSDYVTFGSTVVLQDISCEKVSSYRIVGEDEANFKENLISFCSPIARGLIGRKRKDIVKITTPRGIAIYKILEIKHISYDIENEHA
ncbi:transcription elongation factor GreA [Candidatus Riesia pediculischaeffi]|nr:transcription elongation factor GreA [Candidatus Riesia pediculischaeffi]